ncbi:MULTISPECIES: GNAT family N-acetyltransferase [Paenibacillus]|uniref:GNAT family N-acetyltransferase n=1 Tax=Paenibacillus odorifer TaxID=189426 RepID=A0A1R0X2I7_9BACL|nr:MULTISPECIES: GNAT family N-acetyltransferase [Paenibacillus]ETT45086.1 GCN5-like N-acetyltransferase [Paenibacillus sp. FSL H8-237]MEC0130810.1 GNAT family N-acetyltransferase [Paenibacillus odorifer]MEC0221015.1 GNAT family N-acetyltransferase [Paenibacillus odorifer]OMC97593.1 GNAT family N-acetyltransferase [Paenibacillus odorifer]OMD27250.1 GNAT family N-acetyltransferase [Paenibacillus odorifer]
MLVELKEASISDGRDIFEMIVEIGPGENGFVNNGFDLAFSQFPDFIRERIALSQGDNLPPQYVAQTNYWLLIDSYPVGVGKLRHSLNDQLRKSGGHIGYSIRPSERGKGYGTIFLAELLKKAADMGIDKVMLTCEPDNIFSRKVIEANKGILHGIENEKCNYWITL